jgi:hypothetical protein
MVPIQTGALANFAQSHPSPEQRIQSCPDADGAIQGVSERRDVRREAADQSGYSRKARRQHETRPEEGEVLNACCDINDQCARF